MNLPKTIRLFFLGLVLVTIQSCLSVSERMYNVSRIERTTKFENIVVSYSKPEKKHIIIGELLVRYNSAYKREMALNLMIRKASEYGADGIILNTIRRAQDEWSMSHHEGDTPTQFQVQIYVLTGSMYQYLE